MIVAMERYLRLLAGTDASCSTSRYLAGPLSPAPPSAARDRGVHPDAEIGEGGGQHQQERHVEGARARTRAHRGRQDGAQRPGRGEGGGKQHDRGTGGDEDGEQADGGDGAEQSHAGPETKGTRGGHDGEVTV